jgi:formylglycine-generating enzyme required for sulfatase activity
MKELWCILVLIVFGGLSTESLFAEAVRIEGGSYLPLYGSKEGNKVDVKPFFIDAAPVTHRKFLEFVREKPEWRRGSVKKIFAEESYLQDWKSDLEVPEGLGDSPVTHVSWFAAKAYCKFRGMRLPLLDEWEMVAMASTDARDARDDPEFIKFILAGYEAPKTYRKKIKQSRPNIYGVHDLHGLVWEWVSDFNSVIISGESRTSGDDGLFCAAGSLGASDLVNYAAFIRYAFRASQKANFAIRNLGFRCAKGVEK